MNWLSDDVAGEAGCNVSLGAVLLFIIVDFFCDGLSLSDFDFVTEICFASNSGFFL